MLYVHKNLKVCIVLCVKKYELMSTFRKDEKL